MPGTYITVEAEAYIDDFGDHDLLAEVRRRGLKNDLPHGLRDLVADGLAEIRRGHFDHGATLIEAALSSRTPDPHLERKKYAEAMAAKEASHA
jgi:hypothetical protein